MTLLLSILRSLITLTHRLLLLIRPRERYPLLDLRLELRQWRLVMRLLLAHVDELVYVLWGRGYGVGVDCVVDIGDVLGAWLLTLRLDLLVGGDLCWLNERLF